MPKRLIKLQSIKIRGFTLVEVMMALFIFALMSVIAATALYTTLKARVRIEANSQQLQQLQIAMTLMELDITQMANRPILNDNGQQRGALISDGRSIEFTRAGYINPMGMLQRSTLQRVAYFVQDGKLIRRTWSTLDRPPNAQPIDRTLLTNINSLEMAFLAEKNKLYNSWPPAGSNAEVLLPIAVELKFTLPQGLIKRIFLISDKTEARQ